MSEVATAAPAAPAAPPPPPQAAPAEGAPSAAQNTADQATATAPEGDKPETTETQDPEKRGKSRYERRLDRAYKRAAEAEGRAQFFEKQLAEQRAREAQPADPSAPKLEQFKDIEEYAAAKAKYESEKTLKEHTAKQQAEQQKQQQERLAQDWETKAERGADKYDDWQEVVGEIKPTTYWARGIMKVENGDDVAHFLGKNAKEIQRIHALPPEDQLIEIGRLSAKLAAEPPKPKTPSKAPAPITPLTGASPVISKSLNDPKLSDKEWNELRAKQIAARRRK